jgi:hypothetical protein
MSDVKPDLSLLESLNESKSRADWVDAATYRAIRRVVAARWKPKKRVVRKRRPLVRRRKRVVYSRRGYTTSTGQRGMGPIVITGRGGYWTDKLKAGLSGAYTSLKRQLPAGSFSRFGRAAGGAMYGAPGAQVGGWLGQGVASLTGFGDYRIRQNALMLDEGQQVPTFQDMGQGVIVCHREYITDIAVPATPGDFTNLTFPINPGLTTTFPWLAQVANCFDQYTILGLVFEFRSTSSEFGAGVIAMGKVILATDYDPTDAAQVSALQMENMQYSTTTKPSISVLHPVECDPAVTAQPMLYVRSGGVPSGKDPRFYDHGLFQIATQGLPASTGTIGELWVTYKIAFFKPQLELGVGAYTDYFLGTDTISTAHYLGVNCTKQPGSSLNGTTTDNAYIFNPATTFVGQHYLVYYQVVGTNSGPLTGFTTSLTNCIVEKNNNVNMESTLPGGTNGISNFICNVVEITHTTPGAGVVWVPAGGSTPVSPTRMVLIVTLLDPDVNKAFDDDWQVAAVNN